MKNDILASLSRLSDSELIARMKSLVARERDATAGLVAHLAEMDTRDVYLREGYPSLFVYCREVLGLSEAEAGNRIVAARAARRFPMVLEMLAAGAVNLTAVRLLAPHLTADNHRDVLASARGKSKLEVEEIVARLAPRPDVPCSVRKLPAPRPDPAPPAAASLPAPDPASLAAPPAEALPPLSLPVCPAEVRPLSPDRIPRPPSSGRSGYGTSDAASSSAPAATAVTSADSWSSTTSIHVCWGARRAWI